MHATVAGIVSLLSTQPSVSGIILHGSWAKETNDRSSDIDLLVIDASGKYVAEHTHRIMNYEVDVCKGTLAGLIARMREDDPLNNNFILNAVREGVICRDRDGSAASLKAEAEVIWSCGPAAMSAEELNATRKALHRMLVASKRLSLRSTKSRQAALLAEMRSNQVVVQSIYLYHKVRTRWTNGLAQMLQSSKLGDPPLYDLWEKYARSETQAQRTLVAEEFVNLVYGEESDR